jgi:hypothetical protein
VLYLISIFLNFYNIKLNITKIFKFDTNFFRQSFINIDLNELEEQLKFIYILKSIENIILREIFLTKDIK